MALTLLFIVSMGRAIRIQDSNLHYHITAYCNNQEAHFQKEEDFQLYLKILRFIQVKHQFTLFNYELMRSHVQLFLKPSTKIPLEKTMFMINWKFAYEYNRKNKRKGHFWLGRYKSVPIESDKSALELICDMNKCSVWNGIVSSPEEWKWNGYSFYSEGKENQLITPHKSYLALGTTDQLRQKKYRNFIKEYDLDKSIGIDFLRVSEFQTEVFENRS